MNENFPVRPESTLKGPALARGRRVAFRRQHTAGQEFSGPGPSASAGLGLLVLGRFRVEAAETPLQARDWAWFGHSTHCGGILGPIFLLFGLRLTPASSASLLLILRGMFTALIACIALREHFHARIGIGMAPISAGAAVLAWQGELSFGKAEGPLPIVLACMAWAADNNFTQNVAQGDPVKIS